MENFILRQLKILFTLLEINPLMPPLKDVSSRIILFGSCSTGEDTEKSDIDIFIESNDKKRASELVESCQKKIDRKISPIIMDSYEFRSLQTKDKPLYERINMGKVIHET